MNAEGIERIVITEPGFNLEAEEPWDETSSDADGHCAFRRNETASWRNNNQAGDGSRTGAGARCVARVYPCGPGQDKGGQGGRRGRSGKSVARNAVGGDRFHDY